MQPIPAPPPTDLHACLAEALNGSPQALGSLLEACRPYLMNIANRELPPDLRAKAGASDLVQETFLDAHQEFGFFQGESEDDLRAWLRQILVYNMVDLARRYRETTKRQIGREVPLVKAYPGNGREPQWPPPVSSPSSDAIHNEEEETLSRALDRLPEHYRQVIIWRQQEETPYEEIGRRLQRSAEAARKLWFRAIESLASELRTRDQRVES
jgi:RNA polymerase sigma-70 factor (ECF subfamily)